MVMEDPAVPVMILGIKGTYAPSIIGDFPLAPCDQIRTGLRAIDFQHALFSTALRADQGVLCWTVPLGSFEITQTAFHIVLALDKEPLYITDSGFRIAE
jgi:hypothetical protein